MENFGNPTSKRKSNMSAELLYNLLRDIFMNNLPAISDSRKPKTSPTQQFIGNVGDSELSVTSLSELLVEELAKAVSLPDSGTAQRFIRKFFGRATRKFSELGLELDRIVAEGGLSAGARWVQPRFVATNLARGLENIPLDGPLVIASNHPGSYDSVIISAHVTRPDYKVIIGDIPFFQNLPNLRTRAIFAPATTDVVGRMNAVRESIRHLQAGGALLIFARGGIEADPSISPDAGAEFHLWSRSLEIFLRHVPQARILTAIVSGVIAEAAFHHPVTWLRAARPDKQRLAFMYQMVRQVTSGRETFGLRARVTFGKVIDSGTSQRILKDVATAAHRTLRQHLAWQA
jgi:hypothetical protein